MRAAQYDERPRSRQGRINRLAKILTRFKVRAIAEDWRDSLGHFSHRRLPSPQWSWYLETLHSVLKAFANEAITTGIANEGAIGEFNWHVHDALRHTTADARVLPEHLRSMFR